MRAAGTRLSAVGTRPFGRHPYCVRSILGSYELDVTNHSRPHEERSTVSPSFTTRLEESDLKPLASLSTHHPATRCLAGRRDSGCFARLCAIASPAPEGVSMPGPRCFQPAGGIPRR